MASSFRVIENKKYRIEKRKRIKLTTVDSRKLVFVPNFECLDLFRSTILFANLQVPPNVFKKIVEL